MNHNNKKQVWYCLLLVSVTALACTNGKTRLAKLVANPNKGLVQVRKGNNRTVVMEMMPQYNTNQPKQDGSNLYKVKLILRSNEKIAGNAEMQYMNFGIRNNIYAVQGKDTMRCLVCERIPGIEEKEFLYIAFFDKNELSKESNADLYICLNDTVAGWGSSAFEIKHEVLKELESIKY